MGNIMMYDVVYVGFVDVYVKGNSCYYNINFVSKELMLNKFLFIGI